VDAPQADRLDAGYEQELRRLLRVDLLILDDLALVPNSEEPHPIGFVPAACLEL
jgi:DNA replication protein DnaC